MGIKDSWRFKVGYDFIKVGFYTFNKEEREVASKLFVKNETIYMSYSEWNIAKAICYCIMGFYYAIKQIIGEDI